MRQVINMYNILNENGEPFIPAFKGESGYGFYTTIFPIEDKPELQEVAVGVPSDRDLQVGDMVISSYVPFPGNEPASTRGNIGEIKEVIGQLNPSIPLISVKVEYKLSVKGDNGADGADGTNGTDGITPNIQIGTVTTLEPEEPATVTRTGTDEEPVFDFGIPKGEAGVDIVQTTGTSTTAVMSQNAVTNVLSYDVVISTQSELDNLLDSPTWFNARSVFIKRHKDTGSYVVDKISVPNNVGVIDSDGATIWFTTEDDNSTLVKYIGSSLSLSGLNLRRQSLSGLNIKFLSGITHVKNLDVSMLGTGSNTMVFADGCSNIVNVDILIENSNANIIAFDSCHNISNVSIVMGSGGIGSRIMDNCSNISNINCTRRLPSTDLNPNSLFRDCNRLSGVTISNNISSGVASLRAFQNCTQVVNCDSGLSSEYGYYNCSYGSNNKHSGSGSATGGTMVKWSADTNDV